MTWRRSAAAFFAAFYLRFEGGEQFWERLPLMLRILPYFLVLSVVVCYLFNLTTTKWRFISLPDALNILRAATRAGHSAVWCSTTSWWRPTCMAPSSSAR